MARMVFASVLDSLGDVSSLAFAALAFAVLFLDPRGARSRMSGAELVGLARRDRSCFAYLLAALLRPERF